ncbi:translocator protein 2 isoform X2 [Neophocaena asiaeorientalis asiaeorientalis]|uniref:Translocator protein n=1 Tax=Neophocaena asiaeorientalis asiaeorientalis TaxID=1706337 RepID=A0A341D4N0_NEOAA|nr:translocator protein 2 isoform X2 [Neophocaena asiaeorientalis asiaeorientalis]
MWPQGAAFVALPLLGPTLVWLLTHHWMSGWCDSLRKLPWCPPHRVLLLVWTAIYSIAGYASYLVWKDLGGGFGRPLALPLGLYAVQLAISWTVLILLFTAHTPGLGLFCFDNLWFCELSSGSGTKDQTAGTDRGHHHLRRRLAVPGE